MIDRDIQILLASNQGYNDTGIRAHARTTVPYISSKHNRSLKGKERRSSAKFCWFSIDGNRYKVCEICTMSPPVTIILMRNLRWYVRNIVVRVSIAFLDVTCTMGVESIPELQLKNIQYGKRLAGFLLTVLDKKTLSFNTKTRGVTLQLVQEAKIYFQALILPMRSASRNHISRPA